MRKEIATLLLLTILALMAVSNSQVEATSDVNILSHQSYLSSTGSYYYIVGEVQNVGSQPREYVKITATFYSSNGTMVGTDYTYTEIDIIDVGGKSPFLLTYTEATQIPQIDHYSLSVSSLTATSRPANLKILSNSSYVSSNYLHVIGEIQNLGSSTTTYVKIVATFYDQTGKVVGTDYTFSDPLDIASGQKAPFDITLDEKARVPLVTSYALTAESVEYSLQGSVTTSPSPSSIPSTTPTITSTPTQTPTATPYSSQNPTPSPTIPEFPQTIMLLILVAMFLIVTVSLTAYHRRNSRN